MISVIRNGSILALLLAVAGASGLADQLRRAELLRCNEKTKECHAIGMFYVETDCSLIVGTIATFEWTLQVDKKMKDLHDLQHPGPSPTPAEPSAKPSGSDRLRKAVEEARRLGEELEKLYGHSYYMCRPI